MLTEKEISQIIDSAVIDISKGVAKTDVVRVCEPKGFLAEHPCTIFTKTKGDYDLVILFCTDRGVFRELTRNMKRGADVCNEDIAIYMSEFFNIFCGHVVSAVNRIEHVKAYFDVPNFVEGDYDCDTGSIRFHKKHYYDSPYGTMKLEALYS